MTAAISSQARSSLVAVAHRSPAQARPRTTVLFDADLLGQPVQLGGGAVPGIGPVVQVDDPRDDR